VFAVAAGSEPLKWRWALVTELWESAVEYRRFFLPHLCLRFTLLRCCWTDTALLVHICRGAYPRPLEWHLALSCQHNWSPAHYQCILQRLLARCLHTLL